MWNWFGWSVDPTAIDVAATALAPAIIAYVIHRADTGKRRWEATHEMLRELNSDRIGAARAGARQMVKVNIAAAIPADIDEANASQAEAREQLYELTRYFAQLSVLARAGKLDDRLAFDLFGQVFAHWWAFHFAKRRSDGFRLYDDLRGLHEYFKRLALRPDRSARWRAWLDEGAADRAAATRSTVSTGRRPRVARAAASVPGAANGANDLAIA